eukprot:CAMPEP_0167788218 /NCGR_PEP_ID=MMETSP0111_2-20121227/9900_1 /TAXON_ID=91324 /ORGANISM="Lotharella globosa, Strain CCCM811" /LENGTH=117 /DNA_ID=CAMNT_0007680035 /DNA_START=84 /DNA_END=438 /DNA_ORIENTATION=+
MSQRRAVVKNADMSEEMQQDAVDCATTALSKYNIEKEVAAYIKKEFDNATTRRGIVLWGEILDHMSHMKLSTSSTSTSAKLRFFCSSPDECLAIEAGSEDAEGNDRTELLQGVLCTI